MKKYMMILMALIVGASGAMAAGSMFDGMSKEELANYEITITDKRTGKVVGKMSRAEYKVVSIESSEEGKVRIQPYPYPGDKRQRVIIVERPVEYQNSVILHAGVGKDGLDRGHTGMAYEVSEKDAPVAGATYCRSKSATGLCGSAFTNKTFLLGVKLDF